MFRVSSSGKQSPTTLCQMCESITRKWVFATESGPICKWFDSTYAVERRGSGIARPDRRAPASEAAMRATVPHACRKSPNYRVASTTVVARLNPEYSTMLRSGGCGQQSWLSSASTTSISCRIDFSPTMRTTHNVYLWCRVRIVGVVVAPAGIDFHGQS